MNLSHFILCQDPYDFWSIEIGVAVRKQYYQGNIQDKGQKLMVGSFLRAIKEGGQPIPLEEIMAISRTIFQVLESLRCREALSI